MTATLPASWYSDPAIGEIERHSIWSDNWVMFCTADEVADPGSYVAASMAGWPVLVVRAPDGVLRGYVNVCPHRAGPIAWDGTGTISNLVCRYHGWAFGWNGELKSPRDFGPGADACHDLGGLRTVSVDVWGGLVFVALTPARPLNDDLGALPRIGQGVDWSSLKFVRRVERTLACNWKNYVDNYLEGYHIPLVHPDLNSAVHASTYKVSVVDDGLCVHTVDMRDSTASTGTWLFRYPNLAINVYSSGVNVERILPAGADRTVIEYNYFTTSDDPDLIDAMLAQSELLLDEDQAVVEVVQRNLQSGSYDTGLLSASHENGLAWFQSRVRAEVDRTARGVAVRRAAVRAT